MAEFTIHIDTFAGATHSEDDLGRIADFIEGDEAHDPVVSLTADGVVGATFQVDGDSIEAAGQLGVAIFKRALQNAGITGSSGIYKVRPVGDGVDQYTVRRADEQEAVPA